MTVEDHMTIIPEIPAFTFPEIPAFTFPSNMFVITLQSNLHAFSNNIIDHIISCFSCERSTKLHQANTMKYALSIPIEDIFDMDMINQSEHSNFYLDIMQKNFHNRVLYKIDFSSNIHYFSLPEGYEIVMVNNNVPDLYHRLCYAMVMRFPTKYLQILLANTFGQDPYDFLSPDYAIESLPDGFDQPRLIQTLRLICV